MAQSKREALLIQIINKKVEAYDIIEEMDELKDRFTKLNQRQMRIPAELGELKAQLAKLPPPKEKKSAPST